MTWASLVNPRKVSQARQKLEALSYGLSITEFCFDTQWQDLNTYERKGENDCVQLTPESP